MTSLLVEITDEKDDNRELVILRVETTDAFTADHVADRIETAIHGIDFYGHKRRIDALYKIADAPDQTASVRDEV